MKSTMIVSRYILKAFFKPLALGVLVFSGVLLLDKIFDMANLLINKGVDLKSAVQLYALFLPGLAALSLPLSFLLAGLICYGQLSQDHEMMALRAAGISPIRILWPPVLLGLIFAGGLAYFNLEVAPVAQKSFKKLYEKIAHSDPLIQWEPRRFFAVSNSRIYVREIDREGKRLHGVLLYHLPRRLGQDPFKLVYADEGEAVLESDGLLLNLKRGQIVRFDALEPSNYFQIKFDRYALKLPFKVGSGHFGLGVREMGGRDLLKMAARNDNPQIYLAEYHFRIAIGIGTLFLAFFGSVLGLTVGRGGKGISMGVALIVAFLYYLLLLVGVNLAQRSVLPAWLALQLPNLLCFVFGSILLVRKV